MKNLAPIDELALLRSQLREMEERERSLRDMVLADSDLWVGSKYRAIVRRSTRHGIDLQRLRAAYPDIAAEFSTETEMVILRIAERDDE